MGGEKSRESGEMKRRRVRSGEKREVMRAKIKKDEERMKLIEK